MFDLLGFLKGQGGAPTTVSLQPQYQKYAIDAQTQGQTPMQWPDWLKAQGYQLGPNGQVYPIQQAQAQPQPRQGLLATQPVKQ